MFSSRCRTGQQSRCPDQAVRKLAANHGSRYASAGVCHGATPAKLGNRQGRPGCHLQREPSGVGDRRFCHPAAGCGRRTYLRNANAEQCLHILQHSYARVLFVSTRKQYEKVAAITPLTRLEHIVIMDDGSGPA